MLYDLVEVIEVIQQRIREHGATLRENETRTRMALIDPLLRVLGWDVSDPSLVTPEYGGGQRRSDYALHGTGTTPVAVLEAKKLGEALGNHSSQMIGYALEGGIPYAGLTDGNRWQVYDVFEPVPLADKQILNVSVADTPAHECALRLLLLWRPNLGSGGAVEAKEPFVAAWRRTAETSQVSSGHSPYSATSDWVQLSEFNPPSGFPAPSAVKLPDDTTTEMSSWKQLVIVTARWLYDRGLLTTVKMPVPSGKRGFAANSVPKHPNGSPMLTPESIEDRIFINVHLSARSARENTKKLLQHCGVNPAEVSVRLPEGHEG